MAFRVREEKDLYGSKFYPEEEVPAMEKSKGLGRVIMEWTPIWSDLAVTPEKRCSVYSLPPPCSCGSLEEALGRIKSLKDKRAKRDKEEAAKETIIHAAE